MKKIILILALLGCTSVFAQINEAQSPKDKVIYCPDKIYCENKTCFFSSLDFKYFGKLSIVSNDGSPLSAQYQYQSTTANFHSRDTEGYCDYGNLKLEIKNTSNLEAYRIEGSSWIGIDSKETCFINCPLHEGMGFVIVNSVKSDGITVSVDHQIISKLDKKNSRIIFDDVLNKCGGLRECVIDVQSDQNEEYGYIVVDMDNMKILQVNSLDPIIKINKIDGLNAVEIYKVDAEKEYDAIYCPPVLKCNITIGCTFASIDAKYFGKINVSGLNGGNQFFKFYSASIDADSLKESSCYYDDSRGGRASLLTNPEYHLENYSSKQEAKWVGYGCSSNSANNCPFNKRFDIVIHNVNIGNGLYASIDNTYLSKLFSNNASLSIARHDAEPACGEKTECTINLLSSQQAQYGSITIDMKTMKVLRIDSFYPNYIKITKVSNTDSDIVEISYVTELKFIPKYLR